jgi:hypothetical protein
VQQLLEALGAQLKIGNLTQNGGEMPWRIYVCKNI